MTEKETFLNTFEREYPVTMKVLRAYPSAKSDLKPHDRAKAAKDLAWTFVFEGFAGAKPGTWNGMVTEVERAFKKLGDKVRTMSDADLNKTVKFFSGPKQAGKCRRFTAPARTSPGTEDRSQSLLVKTG